MELTGNNLAFFNGECFIRPLLFNRHAVLNFDALLLLFHDSPLSLPGYLIHQQISIILALPEALLYCIVLF